MGSSHRRPRKSRKRIRLITVVVLSVAIVAVIAVVTGGFGLAKKAGAPSKELTAQDRCESEVVKRLASPSTAKVSTLKAEKSVLDPDSRDLFSLELNDPLKGVDRSRISVWSVSGLVDAQNEFGSSIHDRFDCRAYFVDGNLADTLVLFDHDH